MTQRDVLLERRQKAGEVIRLNLQMKYGIAAQVSPFHNLDGTYGVMIIVPNYTSAMTVQSIFSGEQSSVSQSGSDYIITLTE